MVNPLSAKDEEPQKGSENSNPNPSGRRKTNLTRTTLEVALPPSKNSWRNKITGCRHTNAAENLKTRLATRSCNRRTH
jgi:hypothetical protein